MRVGRATAKEPVNLATRASAELTDGESLSHGG